MILKLIPAGNADDILCKDGEIYNSDFFFGSSTPEVNDGDNSDDTAPSHSVGCANPAFLPPPSSKFLCIHVPPSGEGAVKAIILNQNGALAYADSSRGTSWRTLAAGPFAGVRRVVGVGDYLVVLTDREVLYALYENDVYRWIGRSPEPPSISVHTVSKAFPPYSYADGELASLSVNVVLKGEEEKVVLDWLAGYSSALSASSREAVIGAVREKFKEFALALEGSELCFGSVAVFSCWRLTDGTLFNGSSPTLINPAPARISLMIASAAFSADTLYLRLEVGRSPFSLDVSFSSSEEMPYTPTTGILSSSPDFNADFISAPVSLEGGGRGFLVGAASSSSGSPQLPEDVLPDLSKYGVPDELCSVGGRLLAIYAQGAGRRANGIAVSLVGFPMAVRGIGEVAGGRLMHLTHSLRSLSSAGFGDFPLYAFCSDGVRALSPSEGSFRDVQLISRHVAVGTDAFAPAPGATFFLTEAGVMRIEGTGVSSLPAPPSFSIEADCRLLYSYRYNSLLLFRPGREEGRLYNPASGKWSVVSNGIEAYHYGWPETWVLSGGGIGAFSLTDTSSSLMAVRSAAMPPVPVKTRPIKLGDPFALKKLREIEAVWPDGSLLPVKLYGALRPDKWYFLGCAPKGRMRLRGSGWRFFRVETFAIPSTTGYLLPTLRLEP